MARNPFTPTFGVSPPLLVGRSGLDGPSKLSDIAARLKVDTNYAGQYRLRLIAAELIEPAGHGLVDFTMPYLRDYLREHAVLDAQRSRTEIPNGEGSTNR